MRQLAKKLAGRLANKPAVKRTKKQVAKPVTDKQAVAPRAKATKPPVGTRSPINRSPINRSMNRIDKTFAVLKGTPALIPFITAGYPSLAVCSRILCDLPKAGADLVELGMPFSDPVADGKPLQQAADIALANRTGLKQVFRLAKEFRKANPTTPLILMGYINPIYQLGYGKFASTAAASGVDGVLAVDLPLEEAEPLRKALHKQGLALINLATPATHNQRLLEMLSSDGFLYYAAVTAVTGTKSGKIAPLEKKLRYIRRHTSLPIAVGFGFKKPKRIKNADGMVVGSAIARIIAKDPANGFKNAIAFVRSFAQQLKAGNKASNKATNKAGNKATNKANTGNRVKSKAGNKTAKRVTNAKD